MKIALLLLLLSINVTATIARNSHGRIRRSPAVKYEFRRNHPCPSTGLIYGRCDGFVLDHTIPLCKNGPDTAWNLQWQTLEDSKVKDKWECKPRGSGNIGADNTGVMHSRKFATGLLVLEG